MINLNYVKMSKDLFNLDSEATYLNCAYKAPLLKEAEKDAIKALIKRETHLN